MVPGIIDNAEDEVSVLIKRWKIVIEEIKTKNVEINETG